MNTPNDSTRFTIEYKGKRRDTAERQVRDGSAFIGTPADIVEMIASYNGKVGGIDSVSLHFTPGNMPVEAAERSLRLFAREVLPTVKGL